MQKPVIKSSLPASAKGFSLVEVTIAVSIVSLALITYIGLLPQGLEMSQKTSEATLASNVLENIIRDLESARWTALGNTRTKTFYSDQGVELTAQQTSQISCVAEVDLTSIATLPSDPTSQPYLRRVIIRIKTTPNPDFDFTPANQDQYLTFSHLIGRSR